MLLKKLICLLIIALVDLYRLFRFARIEDLVEELDDFFCAEFSDAYAAPDESLLDDAHSLLELASVFFEGFIRDCSCSASLLAEQFRQRIAAGRHDWRHVWYYDEKALRHDARIVHECLDEFDIFPGLDLHELGRLLFVAAFQKRYVRPNIELLRLDENLNGEIEGVEEVLELEDDGILFIGRFQGEVERRGEDDGTHGAVLEDDDSVTDFLNRDELLGCFR
ncbi:MAG: hypothetical protein JWO73_875 [Candidatus Taylorbacteria bacterium]|nr:hypothetical protein [Candidatus Taylorbacteria bacterium]